MSQVLDPSLAEKARMALGRHEWRAAFDLLSEADTTAVLTAEELELLAQATWWIGRLPDAIATRERAYAAALKSGDLMSAAAAAIALAQDNAFRNSEAASTAWANRAEHLLRDMPETPANGWLETIRGFQIGEQNRFDEALDHATRALEIGRRFGDRDLEALALSCQGLILVSLGRVEEGLAALDEATVTAVAGELEPQTVGGVCCTAIGACTSLGDWQRASEWTEAQDRWCQRERINGFPGMCRLYRAEAKRMRGAWLEAESEARHAADELGGFLPAAVGLAWYEIGMVKLRRGDLPAAEEALIRAHGFNREPEPALSLVRLAQGRVDLARDSIRRAIEEPPTTFTWAAPPGSDINRLALLPAQVEIALAAGDVQTARAAADALGRLAERFPSIAVRAATAASMGSVLVADGDRAGGEGLLRQAIELWSQMEAPYEASRARMTLGRAYAADGAQDRAVLELQAARATFERLGAVLDIRAIDAALAPLADGTLPRPTPMAADRASRTFVFTDIVESTKFAELLGDAAWQDLLRWHDQALRSIVAEHGGEEIKTVGDGFFLAFETADQAIEAAVAIQRRLAEQRQTHGFAPGVRIGIHRAEANRAGLDYVGTGVNTAARVAAEAGGGEILASAPTLAGVRARFVESGRRTAALKGISAPVELVSLDWH